MNVYGKYKFNILINFTSSSLSIPLIFKSNNIDFIGIEILSESIFFKKSSGQENVYINNTWSNPAFRDIEVETLQEIVDADVLTFWKTNVTSDTWPTDPVWNDPSLINAGNEYEAADGVIYDDFNKIIKDLIYLKKYISKPVQLQKKTISITQNGSTIVKPDTDYDGLEEVDINTNITPVLEPLEVTPSKVEQVFLPDAGVDGYSNVTVKATPLEKNKVIVPTATPQTISPVSPNIGFDVISVDPIQLQNKQNVELAFTESSDYQNIYSDESKYMNWVQLKKPATLLPANIKKDVNIAGIVGTLEEGETLPAYTGLLRFASAPTISLSNNTLTITAVDNATSYAIYSNNALLTTITTTSVDLSTLITTAGTYTIYAIAKATGYVDSEKSNEVSYTVASEYSVSCSSYADKIDTSLRTYYSTNNGSTWTEFTNTGILSNKTKQIKFSMDYPSSGVPALISPSLKSVKLGMNLTMSISSEGGSATSENYTLTQNIDDIQYIES